MKSFSAIATEDRPSLVSVENSFSDFGPFGTRFFLLAFTLFSYKGGTCFGTRSYSGFKFKTHCLADNKLLSSLNNILCIDLKTCLVPCPSFLSYLF